MRGKGEGSIYKRADGYWCATIDLGHANGKRKRKTVYGKTRKEVAEKLRELHRQIDQGVNLAAEKQTVQQFLDHWLTHSVVQQRKPKTITSYEQTCRVYIVPEIGHIRLDKLHPQQVQAMITNLQGRGLSNRTVQNAVQVLGRALNRALQWGYVARNVARLVDLPRVEKRKPTILTVEQAKLFLDTVSGTREEPLYRVALGLGLRQGEIIDLHWADVDLSKKTLTIRDGKTEASSGTLPLPGALVTALREHWSYQQQERLIEPKWKEHGLVFPTRHGTRDWPANVLKKFKRALKQADLPDMRFHDLRHSCASFLVAMNVHPRVAMEILRHRNISTTMDIYAHVTTDEQRETLEDLSKLFG
jgi:integrase